MKGHLWVNLVTSIFCFILLVYIEPYYSEQLFNYSLYEIQVIQ